MAFSTTNSKHMSPAVNPNSQPLYSATLPSFHLSVTLHRSQLSQLSTLLPTLLFTPNSPSNSSPFLHHLSHHSPVQFSQPPPSPVIHLRIRGRRRLRDQCALQGRASSLHGGAEEATWAVMRQMWSLGWSFLQRKTAAFGMFWCVFLCCFW